jgi:zinc transport system substrate-binding protein
MLRRCLLACLLVLAAPLASEAAPRVVVSIKPLYALVARVMQGLGTPELLVGGGASLHTYSLKPSQAAALQDADLVVWVGPGLESFLTGPLSALAGKAQVVEAMELPGILLLKPREGGAWEAHHHDAAEAREGAADDEESEAHAHEEGQVDGHLFLDPANASLIAAAVARDLAALDPANATLYAANAAALDADLMSLDEALRTALAPLAERPFVVFHDAYQYFERRYGLTAIGSITVSPDQQPGAKRLAEIRDRIAGLKAICVFAEPGFAPALLRTLLEGTDARSGELDPEGMALPADAGSYDALLRGLAKNLAACLLPAN